MSKDKAKKVNIHGEDFYELNVKTVISEDTMEELEERADLEDLDLDSTIGLLLSKALF